MKIDINNMTIEEYLRYKRKQKDLTRSFNSTKRGGCSKVAPVRYQESYFDPLYNGMDGILEYQESDEDENYRLPPLKPCFQTPQLCAKFNSISHYSSNEVDIDYMTLEEYELYELAMSKRKSKVDNDSMTIEEYELYMAMKCSKTSTLQNSTHGFTSQFSDQSPFTPNPSLDKKDFNLEKVLNVLFRIGARRSSE
ncbi:hypothetical protein Tco_0051883 [Tanacetum coccineum]